MTAKTVRRASWLRGPGRPVASSTVAVRPYRLGPGALRALVAKPALWGTALGQCRAFCPRRWWARWPPLPLPEPAYLSFRLETMYGASAQELGAEQLLAYLEWCRKTRPSAR
jgi:hypothetical protein